MVSLLKKKYPFDYWFINPCCSNHGLFLPIRLITYWMKPNAKHMHTSWASPVSQMVKNLPTMWETWVLSLSGEDTLEEGMATHPVFLPGASHGQRSLEGYWVHGFTKNQTWLKWLSTHTPFPNLFVLFTGKYCLCKIFQPLN